MSTTDTYIKQNRNHPFLVQDMVSFMSVSQSLTARTSKKRGRKGVKLSS
jgi:hypothetical protein